ncbi:MAG TPA: polymer-forming cytoskeletal protein [Gammaproteobacteria bacterium]|nr:polymer-forming cytoskeletal protein [Gammaproteobacteria bacterium]
MFGDSKKPKSGGAKVDTIIGQQTRIEGDIHFTGGLHVDGMIKGNIIAEAGSSSVLTVSEHGRIEGDVRVPTVILNGTVSGDVRSDERIELAAQAEVNGDVYYNLIEMAMGAAVNGSLVHETGKKTSVLTFERDTPESGASQE